MKSTSFGSVFASVFIGFSLVVAAVYVHQQRPERDLNRPGPEFVRATGKCAECHVNETPAVVHQYEFSAHAAAGVTCLDCHATQPRQETVDHNGFQMAAEVTAANCAHCHEQEYEQFLRSRHAAPAWAAVLGAEDFTPEQVAHSEAYHKGAVDRPRNGLAMLEGSSALPRGCLGCHSIGKPNADGSIGSCTQCHARHSTSIELARTPETCGQCHMGPDHSQIEIYHESKHGVLFNAQREKMNLSVAPDSLGTKDMSVPTCSTCHMSGLEKLNLTHDTTERLSWWLFAPVSEKRPGYAAGQKEMKAVCLNCHAKPQVEEFYRDAEEVVVDTNAKVKESDDLVKALRAEGLLTPEPFDEEIEYLHFDLWHYYGRTAKHGAFMGGADFVQWHGNYELLHKAAKLKELAESLRAAKKK